MYAALFNESVDMFISACNSFQAELDHARDKTLRFVYFSLMKCFVLTCCIITVIMNVVY